ncbi:MAG TPA: DUF2784 domain-containing protein, partial [Flavisolibacter sp.]|nr:DUF2784 domain-containing protein [Flavisolibacter sp.]
MLRLYDIFLTVIHLSIIVFNLFGWMPKRTRRANFFSLIITAFSWLVLGIWYGIGYCPFTDWQWDVKTRLGETNLPDNFVEYYAEKITGHDFDPEFISTIITLSFLLAVIISV